MLTDRLQHIIDGLAEEAREGNRRDYEAARRVMDARHLTPERLKYLLDNWGRWQRAERVGPEAPHLCASIERHYASDLERWVWEGSAPVREVEHDPVLAQHAEDAMRPLPRMSRDVLVLAYVHQLKGYEIAAAIRESRERALAILATAETQIQTALEASCRA